MIYGMKIAIILNNLTISLLGRGRAQTRMPTPIQIAPVRQRQQPVRQPVRQQPVQRQPVQQQQQTGGLNAAPYGPSFEMCLAVLLQKHRLNGKCIA